MPKAEKGISSLSAERVELLQSMVVMKTLADRLGLHKTARLMDKANQAVGFELAAKVAKEKEAHAKAELKAKAAKKKKVVKKKAVKLTPPDEKRCQSEITPEHGPFMLGPKAKPYRCENKPSVIATESKPGADGKIGSMSLCKDCLNQFKKQMPKGFATFKKI